MDSWLFDSSNIFHDNDISNLNKDINWTEINNYENENLGSNDDNSNTNSNTPLNSNTSNDDNIAMDFLANDYTSTSNRTPQQIQLPSQLHEPLVSSDSTPSGVNRQKHRHSQHSHRNNSISSNSGDNLVRPEVVFTPLVSPAVTPLDSILKPSTSNNFFSPLSSPALEAKSPKLLKKQSYDDKKLKRRTPGNTPIVGPTIPGRITKQSPIIKPKRSSVTINYEDFQLPPESTNLIKTRSKSKSENSVSNSTPATPATPATLMNFKFNDQTNNSNSNSNSNNSNSNSSSTQDHMNYDRRLSDDDLKKNSHKLAEQGRRNRMNQAIIELGTLIPDELNSTVAIPSKATTVELASVYIKALQNEIKRLNEELENLSNEDVSPLDSTNK